ncbi:MAG TPA: hypothetical protein VKM00_09450 [Luteimonas sp.]|nr:hypothetical protein [Luteimonas sp.]
MSRSLIAVTLFALALSLTGCKDEAAAQKAAPAALVAPTNSDDNAWKAYLGQVVAQNMLGVTDRVYPYYLPANSSTPTPGDTENHSQYDRQLQNVSDVVARTVLPGNMLAFGSPDSAKMGDLIVAAMTGAKPDALKGSQVLFIGKAADNDRVKAVVQAAGGKYIFVEAK